VAVVFERTAGIERGFEGLEQHLCRPEEAGRPCGVSGSLDMMQRLGAIPTPEHA